MKQINKDELYENLSHFLKGKGVDLTEGPYTRGIHAGCSMLADAINLSQAGLNRAKTGLERGMDQVRQVIHEQTAPKQPRAATTPPPQAASTASSTQSPKARKKAHTQKGTSARGSSGRSRRPRK